jgi:hypothetical protein
MSGWKVECPACFEPYLLPAPLAANGRSVRCPGCDAVFAAADPAAVEAFVPAVRAWAEARPGGLPSVREAREEGRFWGEHGAAFLDWCEAGAAAGPAAGHGPHPAVVRAALARVLGPGPLLF